MKSKINSCLLKTAGLLTSKYYKRDTKEQIKKKIENTMKTRVQTKGEERDKNDEKNCRPIPRKQKKENKSKKCEMEDKR